MKPKIAICHKLSKREGCRKKILLSCDSPFLSSSESAILKFNFNNSLWRLRFYLHFFLFCMTYTLNVENVVVLYRYCKIIFMETITHDNSIIQIKTRHNLPSNIFENTLTQICHGTTSSAKPKLY